METLATKNITKIDKYEKTKQHFFDGSQNIHKNY